MSNTRNQPSPIGKIENPAGKAGMVLVCEHASNHIPAHLNNLGLEDRVLQSHAAWDPGAQGVAQNLSSQLDAPAVLHTISRLVIDCNRPPHSPRATPEVSEIYPIPGNQNLTEADRQARADSYYTPFRELVSAQLDHSQTAHEKPLFVAIHSFNPTYHGEQREVEIGILHETDRTLADLLLDDMMQEKNFNVQRNQPYGPVDDIAHTTQIHAVERSLPHVMIEVRNDLIQTAAQQAEIANYLGQHLQRALDILSAR